MGVNILRNCKLVSIAANWTDQFQPRGATIATTDQQKTKLPNVVNYKRDNLNKLKI